MDNYRDLRKKTIDEVFSETPELHSLRKKLKILLVGLCVLRAAFTVFEIVFLILRKTSLSFAIPNICLTLLGILFAYAIYNGASTITFLGILGGLYSLITNFASETVIEYIKTAGDISYNVYMTLLAAVAVIQIAIFAYIAFSKSYKPYFEACLKVNAKLAQR